MPNSVGLGDELHCLEGALRERKKISKANGAAREVLSPRSTRYPLCMHVTSLTSFPRPPAVLPSMMPESSPRACDGPPKHTAQLAVDAKFQLHPSRRFRPRQATLGGPFPSSRCAAVALQYTTLHEASFFFIINPRFLAAVVYTAAAPSPLPLDPSTRRNT